MFLEHFGSKKSNHCVFSLFFAHHGCDNCVEGSDNRSSCLSLSRFCSAFVQDLAVAMELESYKQDRLFQQTVHRLAQALPGRYRGSRHAAVRYIYRQTTLANFIELKSEQPPMTPEEFFALLSAVPGVLKVVPHPKSKLEQKNLAITINNVLSWYTHKRTPDMEWSLSSLHTITRRIARPFPPYTNRKATGHELWRHGGF